MGDHAQTARRTDNGDVARSSGSGARREQTLDRGSTTLEAVRTFRWRELREALLVVEAIVDLVESDAHGLSMQRELATHLAELFSRRGRDASRDRLEVDHDSGCVCVNELTVTVWPAVMLTLSSETSPDP